MEEQDNRFNDSFWELQSRIYKSAYVTIALIICNMLIFIYMTFHRVDVYDLYGVESFAVLFDHEYYRMITSMFMHGSVEHIFSNMVCLLALGAYVEHDLGHIAYLIMYFFSGLIGNVVSIGWDMLLDEYSVSVGASGAVFGVTGAAVVILFFGRKRLKLKGSTIIPRMAAVVALNLYSGYADNTINGAAHFGGLLGGIIITVLITLIGRKQYTMEEWV